MANEDLLDEYYSWSDIEKIFDFVRNVWDSGVKKGVYPRKYKFHGNRMAWWKKSDVHHLIGYIIENGHPPPPGYWFSRSNVSDAVTEAKHA